jgi:hypothetical protein
MLKQKVKDIKELVNIWDLNPTKREQKLEILRKWENDLNEAEFETILEICNQFNYYSEKLTAEAYKSIFEKNASAVESFDMFMQSSLFMPLRRKDRIESAVDMFSAFRLANEIDANRTYVDGPISYLSKYKNSEGYLREIVKKKEQADSEDEDRIQNLQKELNVNSYNKKVTSKINKRISILEAKINKRDCSVSDLVKKFTENYFSVKNIVIIDDFIGTGSSVVNFLKKIDEIIGGSKIQVRLFIWVIEASASGMKEIEEKAKELNIKINISFYKKSIDVLAADIIFTCETENVVKEMITDINKRYGLRRGQYCKNHAIASFVNAPNNNLTLLSEESSSWTALFLRTKRNKNERKLSKDEIKDAYQYLTG